MVILAVIPPMYIATAKIVLGAIFALLAIYLKANTDNGRESAARTRLKLEGWYHPDVE